MIDLKGILLLEGLTVKYHNILLTIWYIFIGIPDRNNKVSRCIIYLIIGTKELNRKKQLKNYWSKINLAIMCDKKILLQYVLK